MGNNKTLTKSIIKTLCYAQVFSYPLTEPELWKYLVSNGKITKQKFSRHLFKNLHHFEQIQEYFVLRGDKKLVSERIKRHAYTLLKLKKAYIISKVLFCIPTIKLIGVSGSVSMFNAKKEDDIDLFFITKKDSLWTTRLLVNAALFIMGQKRMRGQRFAQDKICPNMFMAEDSLRIKKADQNIYTAHEVAQMKVLFARKHIYEKFLSQNAWVLDYMPNAFTLSKASKKRMQSQNFLSKVFLLVEKILYKSQYFYMKKRITNETVSRSSAAFHPAPHKKAVLELYGLKTLYHTTSRSKQKRSDLASNYRQIN